MEIGAVAKGYTDYTEAAEGGALFRAEVEAGFSHSRQKQASEAQITQDRARLLTGAKS